MKPAFEIHCFLPLCLTLLSIAIRVNGLRYLSGDFLNEPLERSPHGELYPRNEIAKLIDELPKERNGRSMQFLKDPWTTRKTLMEWQNSGRTGRQRIFKEGREITQTAPEVSNTFVLPPDIDATIVTRSTLVENGTTFIKTTPTPTFTSQSTLPTVSSCESSSSTPQRFCKTKFNTTAPMYGVSLTSGNPVTIVQKFPDLLQQVIFEVCASDTCDVVHGECIQTYVPYLFLVIPLGPVTLTGQDYVLVESGCVCRPRYAGSQPPPNPLDEINFGLGE